MRAAISLLIGVTACGPLVDEAVFEGTPTEVVGVPNFDDDDGDGLRDALAPAAGDDDHAPLALPPALTEAVAKDCSLFAYLYGDGVRIYQGDTIVLDDSVRYWDVPEGADPALAVEFTDYLQRANLQLALVCKDELIGSAYVRLRSAPFQMNHHLQAAEHLYVMKLQGYGFSNLAMIEQLTEIVGESNISVVPSGDYEQDVWIQDEIEFGHLIGKETGMELILDSIRGTDNVGLDPFPEDHLAGPGVALDTYGAPRLLTSLDSFGNLEASPPVSVNGVNYPFGRIYFGRGEEYAPAAELQSFLNRQGVQAPVYPDSSWLCVGHVDEYMTFIPDPSAPKGFRFAITDVNAAYEFLEGLDPEQGLPQYESFHGYSSVGDILNDGALRALNKDWQADQVDPTLTMMKQELGLDESDIIRLPLLFEDAGAWCGHTAIALMPGMVNLAVWNPAGETPHLLIPDPFFREDLDYQASDPLIAAFDAAMPEGVQTHYLDDWTVYHEGMGEVHCGTNIRRAPSSGWWEDANHLLEVSR